MVIVTATGSHALEWSYIVNPFEPTVTCPQGNVSNLDMYVFGKRGLSIYCKNIDFIDPILVFDSKTRT
jgi:hypothetical protein